jgi:DNA polymerase I-like protein with 3'-5' exonuclease and polymerase domains
MSKFAYLAAPYIVRTDLKVGSVRLAFDVEADGLLDTASKVHCIVAADLDSDQVDEYGPEQITAALVHLKRADYLTGHNVCNYDLPLLRRLYNWTPTPGCTVRDTLIASRLVLPHIDDLDDQATAMGDPSIGKLRGRHSLEAWGARLGMPKIGADIEDWSIWTPEMQERCAGDVKICKAVWRFLAPDGYSCEAMELEHRVAGICNRISADGVPFDVAAAERLRQEWTARRAKLEAQLQQQFPGTNLNSRKQLGGLLEARGWIAEKRTEKTKQPKIDDELLEALPALYPEFTGLAEHYTLGRRLGQLADGDKAWLKHVGKDGRIHGAIVHIGTPHSRAAHFGPNLGQIPSVKRGKPFAHECRALFHHPGDWRFVTCDQAGLQDRCFSRYLAAFDGGEYGRSFVAGADTHWKSAIALELISPDTERDKASKLHTVLREGSKSFRYGFLFGMRAKRAGEILATIIRAARQVEPSYGGPSINGGQALRRFEAATPGLKQLRESLKAQAAQKQWVPGLDGRRVPTGAQYKALNRIVTSAEAVICKRWLVKVYDELCARFRYGWDGDVVISAWVHDELCCCARPEIAEQVGEIMVRHAKEPGEFYGLKVPLDAAFTIGNTWAGEPLDSIQKSASEPALDSTNPTAAPDELAILLVEPTLTTNKMTGGNGAALGGKVLCPFHKDHTPSLHIYLDEDDPHYHCFVCGAHGHLDDLPPEVSLPTETTATSTSDGLARATKLWSEAKPIGGTLAEEYLAKVRGIDISALPPDIGETLRFHPRCPFGPNNRVPCLVALYRDVVTNDPAGIHRIALTPDVFAGGEVKRWMLGRWSNGPRVIKLWPAAKHLYCGEGIETVLAAATKVKDQGQLMQPAWAAGPEGNIGKLPIIPEVKELSLLVDHGAAGEQATAACRLVWHTAGRKVRRLRTRDPRYNDFNDLVLETAPTDWDSGFEEIKDDAEPAAAATKNTSSEGSWPTLAPEALHGLAGEVVETLKEHTESDPVALLVQYLVYFGNCIGRLPYYPVESTRHYPNLFAVLVGATAKSRKGTSADRIRRIFETTDAEWAGRRIHGGMSSGEGVVYQVRDPVYGVGKKVDEIVDAGIDDKRLLLDEREFFQALTVMRREGNTLSRVLRDAWDCRETIGALTKHSPTHATNALISVVGHITAEELRETLDHTSIANGYANRFLFACIRRGQKLLPFGSPGLDLSPLGTKTSEVINVARKVGPITWTAGGASMWEEVYPDLSQEQPGMLGAITARAEAQTIRLAMIYALLNRSSHIRRRHLRAALALWRYCDASARFVFGDLLGDPVADAILRALRQQSPAGMSRTSIRDLFDRHTSADKIQTALTKLLIVGKARRDTTTARGPGRPVEMWYAV